MDLSKEREKKNQKPESTEPRTEDLLTTQQHKTPLLVALTTVTAPSSK